MKPNVFAALQVDNPDIQKNMETFQQSCLEFEPRLKDFLVPVRKAHITLLVVHIAKERMEEATSILKELLRKRFLIILKLKISLK